MAKKVILRKETIPDAEKVLGQVAVHYNAGGNYQASFSSSDVNNFNVVDEGQIEIRDPERSYLTSTLYPLSFIDSFRADVKNNMSGFMTDNLYATSGVSESAFVGVKELQVPLFKRALIVIDYFSNYYAKDAFKTQVKAISATLRNVLITKNVGVERFSVTPKAITGHFRSVLIEYKDWAVDKMSTKILDIEVPVSTLFSTKFKTLLIGDSENVNTVISDKVVTIKDAGVLTWKVPNTLNVDRVTPKMDNQTLIIDEDYEYISSNQSIGVSSESGVELFFEDWFKTDLSTTSLLTTYNYKNSFGEMSPLEDKTGKFTWTSNTTFTGADYILNRSQYLEASNRGFNIPSPVTGQKGTTIEITCKVEGTDRIYILSNGSQSFNNAVGESLALVWFGENSTTNKNKFALIADKSSLVDSNNILLVSTSEYPTGSEVHIAIVAYEGYYRLFINGTLQGVKTVTIPLNFSYGSKTFLGKSLWYNYVSDHKLTIKSFRFTNLAIYTSVFNTPNPYTLTVIPNIPKVSDVNTSYRTGITCGLRYDQSENIVYAFAAVTDTYGETFTVRSTPIDCSKWNFIQLANTGSELTLFINGVANSSRRLPYNIKFKDILLGGRDANNFKGAMDNFRIYSKLKDSSLLLRSSELFMKVNDKQNINLDDSNGLLKWNPVLNPSFTESPTAVRKTVLASTTAGIYTDNANLLLNKDYFELFIGAVLQSYHSSSVVNFNLNQGETVNINFTQDKSLYFKLTVSSEGAILNSNGLTMEAVSYSSSAFKLKVTIAGETSTLETPFRYGVDYKVLFFKLDSTVYLYIDNVNYLTVPYAFQLSFTELSTDTTSTITALSTYSFNSSQRTLVDNSDGTNGLVVSLFEVFKDIFILEATYNSLLKSVSTSALGTGYQDLRIKQDATQLSFYFNDIEAGVFENPYVAGSSRLVLLNNYSLNKSAQTGLSYFSAISSQQDGVLGVPYEITTIHNETIYNDIILNLSSDSLYGKEIIDRSANPKSKEVLNITTDGYGVTKALKEPGFYFDGKSNLSVDSDDFAFGTEDFYIEFEVKLKALDNRAVILDRYTTSVGSWQVSVNTDGHLYFTITNSNTSPYYYFIDIPAAISTDKWYKIQISRSGAVYKFYLNDEMIYEYSTGLVFDFNKTGIPLSIGRQMTVRNDAYDFKGYLNNLRIVKGSSLDSDYGESNEISTVPFSDYEVYLDDKFNEELLEYGAATAKGIRGAVFTNNGLALAEGSGYGYKDTNSLVGTNASYMSAPLSLGTGDFKLSFDFMYPQSADSGYAVSVLQFGTEDEGGNGFALSIFRDGSGNTYAYLRDAYSRLVAVACSPNTWHKMAISKEGSNLYLTVDGNKSSALGTSSDFNSEKLLVIGRSYGQWLQHRPVYFDNIRLTLGNSVLDTYASETGSTATDTSVSVVENYNMYSSNASTMLHVHAASGVIKDSKNLSITQEYVSVAEVFAENFQNCMLFRGDSKIYTTASIVDTVFTTTSNFTVETNFAVKSLVSNQILFRSYNNTARNTHWLLKLDDDLQGVTFSVNTGSNIFKDYSIRFKLELSTWYKLAVTVEDGNVLFHLNNDIYRFADKIPSWQAKGTLGSTTYFGENFIGLAEVLKITNKALYSKGKGIRNLNRSSHLQLNRGFLVDDGNTPSVWNTDGVFVASSFKGNLKSLSLEQNSYLESVQVLNPERGAFAVTANISFDDLVADFGIFNITFDDNMLITLSKIANAVVLKILSESEEVASVTLPQSSLLNTYNIIKVSRDFSNSVELQVNGYTTTTTNIGNNLSKGTLRLTGFKGQVHEVEVFNLDSTSIQSVYNIFNLSFEKGAITGKYTVANNEGLIFDNNLGIEVKGLSKSSDSVMSFDGFESYLYTPQNYKFLLEKENFDLTFTMYPTNGNNAYQTIISNGFTSFSGEACFVMMYGSSGAAHVPNSANKLAIGTSQGVNFENNPFLISNSVIPYNTWTTVKIVREGSTWSLYLNGVLETTAIYSGNFNLGLNGTYIGRNVWDGANGYYTGYLEDVSLSQRGSYFFNEEVTLNEGLISGLDFEDVGVAYEIVKSPYKPDYVDSYTNTWSYGRYNTSADYPYHETVSAVNEALFFPGRSYMFMYNKHFAPGLDPFSISVDFMQTQRTSSYIFCIDTMYHLRVSNNNLYFRFNGTDYDMGVVSLSTWYTFAISRDSNNTVRFFMDGKLKQTLTNNKTNVEQGTSFYPMVLGRRWDYRDHSSYVSENFIGYIDNFYFERGYAKYTADYSVYTDKTVKNTYDSLLSFTAAGPTDKNTNLVWTSGNISYVTGMSEFRNIGARNTTTSGYLQSTSTGVELGYSDFTIEFYFRPSQIIAETCLLDLSVDSVTQRGIKVIQPPGSTSSITVQIGSASSTEWERALNTGINTIENNRTYHLRLTRNLGTIYLYLDGSLKAKSDYTSYISINSMITLFNNISRNKGFNGVIEQFRFKYGQSFSAEASFPKLTGEFR